jgi:DNA polymerase I
MRDSAAGALTKYFGKVAGAAEAAGGDEYTYRGIECRQRSTPAFVADAQRDLIRCLDATRDPAAVCDRLQRWLSRLRSGDVDPSDLVVAVRVSKSVDEYSRSTRTVAALERARHLGISRHPGQTVRYVVADDSASSADRVRLAIEAPTQFDEAFYRTQLIRASSSVLSPLGWREEDVRDHLATTTDRTLLSFDSC